MILISRKVDYGILVLCSLARQASPASARELADQFELSRHFVANILKLLCHAGMIDSQRGVHGGYHLAKPARHIRLIDVIATLDGPFQLMSCANSSDDADCRLFGVCPVRSPLRAIHDRLLAVLSEATIDDLARSEQPLVAIALETNGHVCAADLPR